MNDQPSVPVGPSRRSTRFRLRLPTVLWIATVLGCAAVILASWLSLSSATRELERSSFERLTALRETKRRAVLRYLDQSRAQVSMLAGLPWIHESLAALDVGMESIVAGEGGRDELLPFYEGPFANRMVNGGAAEARALVPDDPIAVAAQLEWIVRNPAPLGAKDDRTGDADGDAYERAHARIHPTLRALIRTYGYYDLFLVGADDARVVYSVFKETDFATRLIGGPHADSGLGRAATEALALGRERLADDGASRGEPTVFVDFSRYAPSYFAPAAFIAAPIVHGGALHGALVVQLPIDRLNGVMTGDGNWERDGLGASGETYLIGSDRLMRSDSRFLIEDKSGFLDVLDGYGVEQGLRDRIDAYDTTILFQPVDTEAARRAIAGDAGTAIVADYRGVPVLSSFAPLVFPGAQWAILSEIDAEEVFAPVRTLRRRVLLLTGVVVLGFLALAAIGSVLLGRNERMRTDGERRENDLAIARSIQRGLLPKDAPRLDGYDIAGWSRPADETGGDYFDWQVAGERSFVVSLADVSGHGIGPALVTAVCRAYARASISGDIDLRDVLRRMNALLVDDLPDGRFVTFVFAHLDADAHHVTMLSAGHAPLLLYRAETDSVEMHDAHELPLGILDDDSYSEGDHYDLAPGDVLVLLTDGFFEWQRPDGEQWGTDRLCESIRRHATEPSERMIAKLYADVQGFVGREQDDDLTAVVVKRDR